MNLSRELYRKYWEMKKEALEFAKKEVIRLYEKTGSMSEVAKLLSCSRNTILRRFKEGDDGSGFAIPKEYNAH